SQLVESPAWPCGLLGPVARPPARYHVPPSTPAAGVRFRHSHRFFSCEGLGVGSGGIGVRSMRLAARVRAPDAHEGLAVVTGRCQWRSSGSVRRRVGSCVWLPFGNGSPIPPFGARAVPDAGSVSDESLDIEHLLGV